MDNNVSLLLIFSAVSKNKNYIQIYLFIYDITVHQTQNGITVISIIRVPYAELLISTLYFP